MIKVSIVIPVYNAEEYLEKCIESCLNQSMIEVEIIIVDDASTDKSSDIMKKFEAEYPDKIRCFYQKVNQRQGAARNLGTRHASGEFITFVDSDDYIDYTMCEKLYNLAIRDGADIVYCDILRQTKSGEFVLNRFPEYLVGAVDEKRSRGIILNRTIGPCAHIIRRNILNKEQCFFPENILCEDTAITKVWDLMAKKIGKVAEPLYFYRMNTNSTGYVMRQKYYRDDFQCILFLYNNLINLLGPSSLINDVRLVCTYFAVDSFRKMREYLDEIELEKADADFRMLINNIGGANINMSVMDRCFTPYEQKLIYNRLHGEKGLNLAADYYEYYKKLRDLIEKLVNNTISNKYDLYVWSDTVYANAFVKVFSNTKIINEKSVGNDTERINVIALRETHIENIKKNCEYKVEKIINLEKSLYCGDI